MESKERKVQLLPFQNRNFEIDERVKDLISRMTMEEKARQLDQYWGARMVTSTHPKHNTVMAEDAEIDWKRVNEEIGQCGVGCIHDLYANAEVNNALQKFAVEETRLGIPILFSEEALHGLCKPGCTIFPQQITLASTWDPEIVQEVGHGIAAETRSLGIHETFGPVIDLARDPRWGRVEETYGEDTYLSSRMAVAMVRGLQGEDVSQNDRIAAEPKHFAAYGVPAGGLNCGPALIGTRELYTYYLPVFQAAFMEGGALNTMCSYNSIDGIPCAGDHHLLTDILREQWGMEGFVRSDLGAISRLYSQHCTADSEAEAVFQALEAGVDMQYYDFSHEMYQEAIIQAVKDGRIKEETVNRAVSRILKVKFMLGLFDNPYTDTELSQKVVRCEKHQHIALEAAKKAICLLKNENNLLPLDKNISSIAVIGPNAASAGMGDYTPYVEGFNPISVLDGIKALISPDTKVEYVRGTGVLASEMAAIPARWLQSSDGGRGLIGEYFNNTELEGAPVLRRTDLQIDFNWMITKPTEEIDANHFSVRWIGKLVPERSFHGSLGTRSLDSMRLWVDDCLLIDGWGRDKDANQTVNFQFTAGRAYDIRIEYRKDAGGVRVMLGWSDGQDEIEKAVEAAARADVVIMALGDSPQTCGEGIDRADLDLPGHQLKLLKAVYAAGTPIVLVLQNGRPLTLTWEAEHIPAIIEAWYPGEKGGYATAEVLFGDVNPGGRLPISFPKYIGQLPVYYNRQPGGSHHYVEMDWNPLFPFGYGLSYTHFDYENLTVTPRKVGDQEKVTVTFDVVNTGDKAGDEVAQLYLRDCYSSVVRPIKELKRFKRVHLEPHERRTLSFTLLPDDLKLLDRDMQWTIEPGSFSIMIGPNSQEVALSADFEVIRQ